jgi:hypothetical protein
MSFATVTNADVTEIVKEIRNAIAIGNKNAISTTSLERILALCESVNGSGLNNVTENDATDGRVVQS